MEKRKLRKNYDFVLQVEDMEVNTMPSMTVPDESMTVREIVNQFVRTGRTDERLIRREGGYETNDLDAPDLSKLSSMDFTEKDELLSSVREKAREQAIFLKNKKKAEEQRQGEPRRETSSGAAEPTPAKKPEPAKAPPKEGGSDE